MICARPLRGSTRTRCRRSSRFLLRRGRPITWAGWKGNFAADLCGKEPAEPCAMIHSVAGPMLARGLAVILDMDGVIIDSNPVHREAWRLYNQRFGIQTDEAMLQRMYGRRNDDIIRDFFGDHLTPEDMTRHGADKETLYREMMAGSIEQALVPGIRQFLE